MKKRLLFIFLTVCFLLTAMALPASAAETVASGTCGGNLTWILDDEGTLTISGNGDMTSYSGSSSSYAPWYDYRSSITNVVISDGVTSVGNCAFDRLSSLTDVTIPDSVTSIGQRAFYCCSSLTSVAIPDSVTSIGTEAFYYCSSLTDVAIPDSVTSIGTEAFSSCSSLTSVTIPDSVTSIGASAFSSCTSLMGIYVDNENPNYSSNEQGVLFDKKKTVLIQVPGGISGEYAIPDSVTSIGSYAFYGCRRLNSISIPGSVTSIGNYLFESHYGPDEIIFEGDAPAIKASAFDGLVGADVYYPAGNETWTEDVLQDYGGYFTWKSYCLGDCIYGEWYIVNDAPCHEEGEKQRDCTVCDGYETEVIPVTEHDYVDGVCSKCGTECMALDAVYTVTSELYSFTPSETGYFKLSSPDENASCTANDGKYMLNFDRYHSSPTLYLPETFFLTAGKTYYFDVAASSFTISEAPGMLCGEDVYYTLEEGVLNIFGSGAMDSYFYGYTIIAPYWAASSDEITRIVIEDGVTTIGSYAFYCCKNLESVSIPESVTWIPEYAFAYCYALTDISIPDSVTSIGTGAFSNCTSLTSLTIPDSVTSIGTGVSSFDGVFAGCSALTELSISKNLNYIGHFAFQDCSAISSITFTEDLEYIGMCAFSGCSNLTEITFTGDYPEGEVYTTEDGEELVLASIRGDAFEGVTATAYYPAGNETWTEDVMQDYGGTITWVPYEVASEPVVETTPMYRLYNPNSGEHFYTGSVAEKDNLVTAGWIYEGIAWNAPVSSGEPVYRLYAPGSGDHHYTMSAEERDMLVGVGWVYEGICWNSASADNLPLYRLYNPNAIVGSHHYTGSEEERDTLVGYGWIYEGIGWFGMLN